MAAFTFKQNERLKSRKQIQSLFKEGKSIRVFPVRMVWIRLPEQTAPPSIQAAFSVPRRAFSRAVDRNRIKRQMREAYRLQKNKFLPAQFEGNYIFMFIYMGREKLPSKRIAGAIRKSLKKFSAEISNQP